MAWSWVTSTAAKITPNAVAGYRRRNASGAVVRATPGTTHADSPGGTAGCGGWPG